MLFNKDEKSKIKKLHDSVKDSDALSKLAYEFAQMASYFDRANSPRSREILGKEDESKYREFVRKAIQVKAQLQSEVNSMKKGMKQEQKLGWYKADKNKTARLIEDGIHRLSYTCYDMHDNTGKRLADELSQLLKEYEMLLEEGPRAFDSKTKDKKVKDAAPEYPATSSYSPNIIEQYLGYVSDYIEASNSDEDQTKWLKLAKRSAVEARKYIEKYSKECATFEQFAKDYRKYLTEKEKELAHLEVVL